MKNRILLTIVALVILPTALLSLLAGRSVRNRELLLMTQMRTGAVSMTRLCSVEIDTAVKAQLNRVRETIGAVLMRTASVTELGQQAKELEQDSGLIDQVIVYHDPWEIIYPFDNLLYAEDSEQSAFKERLRVEIAQNEPGSQISINDNGVYYVFTPVQGRRDLYAGFTVDVTGFRDLVNRVLGKLSSEDILLSADNRLAEPEENVVIEDTMSSAPIRKPADPDSSAKTPRPLASLQLNSPFNDVTVSAYAKDIKKLEKAGKDQSRLLVWGIALLTGGIVAGVIILIFQINAEIRRTSARANYIIGISHDLRTPISSLKMMTESLYSGTIKDPERKQKFLKTMAGECERLNRLVERVLYFVRYGEDALIFFKKTIDISSLVRNTVTSFIDSSSGSRNELTCTVQIASDLPEIEVDDNAVSQVILNLMDNALKYGRKSDSSSPVQVTVSADCVEQRRHIFSPARKWVRISIADSGDGINPADVRKLFRPYFRSRSAAQANISGVGLGLALCRHIAHAHNGWIEASNHYGGGALFSIYLPA